jgi:kinetochore protein NDC80
MLTTPTTKDFQFVLEFLLRGVDPNYALDPTKAKFEDEVIGVFKALGYPFEIRKQALYTVGSPHSWPALVATLTWLIDVLEYDEEVAARKAQDDCFDADMTFKIFFDYLTKAYQRFLDGEDESPELDDELSMIFENRNGQVKAEVATLSDANAQLRAQLHALRSTASPLEAATQQNEDLQSDVVKFRKFVTHLDQQQQQLTVKVDERTADLRAIEAELAAVNAEIEHLRAQLAVQELSPADVQRMNGERNRLEGELKCARALQARPRWSRGVRSAARHAAPTDRLARAHCRPRDLRDPRRTRSSAGP